MGIVELPLVGIAMLVFIAKMHNHSKAVAVSLLVFASVVWYSLGGGLPW